MLLVKAIRSAPADQARRRDERKRGKRDRYIDRVRKREEERRGCRPAEIVR